MGGRASREAIKEWIRLYKAGQSAGQIARRKWPTKHGEPRKFSVDAILEYVWRRAK